MLEIGPGRGAITAGLLARGARVTAVEYDSALAATLPGLLKNPEALRVIDADFLRFDLAALGAGPWLIVANLPYAVGAPILQKLLDWDGWTRAVLMFQKEVAERVCAEPGGPDYGLLTLSVLARAEARYAFAVDAASFSPKPKVDSAVVELRRLESPRLPREEEGAFWRAAKAAFAQRRKMAAGPLSAAFGKTRAEADAALAAAGVPKDARPERIPFDAWRTIAAILTKGTVPFVN